MSSNDMSDIEEMLKGVFGNVNTSKSKAQEEARSELMPTVVEAMTSLLEMHKCLAEKDIDMLNKLNEAHEMMAETAKVRKDTIEMMELAIKNAKKADLL